MAKFHPNEDQNPSHLDLSNTRRPNLKYVLEFEPDAEEEVNPE